MKLKCNDLKNIDINYRENEIAIKFTNSVQLLEFARLFKNVFYAGPGFPNDFISVNFNTE